MISRVMPASVIDLGLRGYTAPDDWPRGAGAGGGRPHRARPRDFGWPGALEIDGRALGGAPRAGARRRASRGWSRVTASRRQPPTSGRCSSDGPPDGARLLVGRLLVARRGSRPARRGDDWLTGPPGAPGDRTLGLDVLSCAADADADRRGERSSRPSATATRRCARRRWTRSGGTTPPAGRPLPRLPSFWAASTRQPRGALRGRALVARGRQHADPARGRAAAPLLLERLDDADRLIRRGGAPGAGRASRSRAPSRRWSALAAADSARLPHGGRRRARLAAMGAAAALPILVRLLRHRPVDELARHADLALGEIATPPAVAALVAALRASPGPRGGRSGPVDAGRGRRRAARCARWPAPTPSSGVLAPRAAGRRSAIAGPTRPLTRAVAAPESSAAVVRVAVAALGRLQDPARSGAGRAAEAPQADVRLQAVAALQALADRAGASPGWSSRSRRRRSPVRASAARLAGALGARRSGAAALAERLGDDDSEVRLAAARALRVARTGGAALRDCWRGRSRRTSRRPPAPVRRASWRRSGTRWRPWRRPRPMRAGWTRRSWRRRPTCVPWRAALAVAHAPEPLDDRAIVDRRLR